MSATSCPAEEEQVRLSAVLSLLYMRKSTVLFLQEEQFGNHLIQMLFVSVFPFLLSILKVFLLKYSLSQSATVLRHLRGHLQVTEWLCWAVWSQMQGTTCHPDCRFRSCKLLQTVPELCSALGRLRFSQETWMTAPRICTAICRSL